MNTALRLLILTLAPLTSFARPDEPNLSGRWTLDPAKSEDGREKMREAGPTRGPRGGSGGFPRGGPRGA